MGNKLKQIILWGALGLALVIILAAGILLGWQRGVPLRVVDHYSMKALQEEIITMNECAECHEGPDFHLCSTCHDDHGAVEFAELPFFNLISFSGDVPRPGFVEINQILPYRDHPGTHVQVIEFLAEQGVEDFESVTLTSRDGGFITISRQNLTDQALLLPYTDGVRFAAEDLHVSTWLKGITGMIVVSRERDLLVNGESTSLGRLLLGPTRQVVVEEARVMFSSDLDGKVREAATASRVWGAALSDIGPEINYSTLIVRDQSGGEHRIRSEQADQAVLVPALDGPTLVLPGQSRSDWVVSVAELEWEE